MYGVSGGKSEAGTTESNVAVIFPVRLEMTKVAAETRPDLTAREEAMTEIGRRRLWRLLSHWEEIWEVSGKGEGPLNCYSWLSSISSAC